MITNQDKIYCVGDSHVDFFKNNQRFIVHWLGPVTAYNLEDKKELFEVLNDIPKGSYVMLVAGEIDCRAHLEKQTNLQNRFLIDVVSDCVDKYFKVIKKLKELYFKPIIWGVTASSIEQIDKGEYKSFGDCKNRNYITSLFNKRLKYWSEKEDIPMISIFEKLIDDNYLTKTKYYKDAIHLSPKVMPWVIKQLEKKL